MGKGTSNTTTQNKTYSPAAMGAYQSVLDRAMGVASTPYQAYGGQLTAGINPYQQRAFGAIDNAAGFASPYISEAAGFARGAAGPITDADISRYMDPYTQRVIDATRRQFDVQNARDQSALVGNAAAKGALGGDRVSVAQASLAGEKARAQDPIIAGLYSQGYQGALGAAQAEAARKAQAAGQIAGFGVSGAQAGLAGGQAMLGAGTLEQQTEQQRLSALYNQYQLAQAYPYQQLQWLAGITSGVGSQMGGTTTGEMTKPPPDPWATAAGLGLGAAGLFLSDARAKRDIEPIGKTFEGLPIYRFSYSGDPSGATQIGLMAQDVEQLHPEAVAEIGGMKHIDPVAATEQSAARAPQGFAEGGVPTSPWGNVRGFIPEYKITPGRTEPDLDKWPEEKATDWSKIGQLGATAGQKAWDKWGGSLGSLSSPGQDYSLTATGGLWNRGGAVWVPGGYAEGGDIPWALDDRFSAAFPNATRSIPPALDDAVKGFADRYPALTAFSPTGSDPEVMRGGLQELGAERERALRAQSLSKPVPTYSSPVPEEPERVPLPPTRSMVAGVAPPPTEEPVPVTARSAPGRPPVMATDDEPYPAFPAYSAPAEAPAAPRRGFGLLGKIDDATGQALLAAGFGMLASRSPHLGVAIGDGGLTGMSAFAGAKATEREAENQRISRAQAAERLAETARHHRDTLAERERHHRETLAESKARRTSEAWKPTGQVTEGGSPILYNPKTGELLDSGTGKPPDASTKIVSPRRQAVIDDETARDVAVRYIESGNRMVLSGLGRTGENMAKIQKFIRDEMAARKITPAEIAHREAEWEGRKAGQRALGTMQTRMDVPALEAKGAIQLARGVIEKMPRTTFLPLNKLVVGYQNQTLDPDQRELYARTQAIINTYSAVMARGASVVTDSARHKAESLLSTAFDAKTYNRVLDTLQQEIDMAITAPKQVQELYRKQFGRSSVEDIDAPWLKGGASPPPATVPPPARTLSDQDQKALDWSKSNPNDPRANEIKKRLGVQ